MRTRLACLVLLTLTLLASATIRAQELVVNGDFGTDLTPGWQTLWFDTSWSSLDVANSPVSGSAHGRVGTGIAPATIYLFSQCIPITQSGLYIFGASGFVPSGEQFGAGLISISGNYQADLNHADCAGPFSVAGFIPLGNSFQVDQWMSSNSGGFLKIPAPPNPAMSIKLSLAIGLPDASNAGSGNFDAVSLIRDTLFVDGFE